MTVDAQAIHGAPDALVRGTFQTQAGRTRASAPPDKKSRAQESVPALVLAGCPDKINPVPNIQPSAQCLWNLSYALLLGRTVRSRTWVRMLDICIPFSCETKGSSSAIN